MNKIVTVLGARPQFIKAALISKLFREIENINEVIINTGQHFDDNMSKNFINDLSLGTPNYNLNINNLNHGAMTGRMLEQIEKILLIEKTNLVIVYGDTNSTLAGALAAKKLHIKIAHIEAGLRSYNNKMPEEINRLITDRISDYLFCPSADAIDNLKKEGIDNNNCDVYNSGDVMYDTTKYFSTISKQFSKLNLNEFNNEFILCTIHRAENTENIKNLKNIIHAINTINNKIQVVLPLHPRTKKIIQNQNIAINVKLIEPVGYFDMIELLKQCQMVLTDSGGLQKEAYYHKKYCITLRDETEWHELIEIGANTLTGANNKIIINEVFNKSRKKITHEKNPYSIGNASEFIVNKLTQSLK